MSDPTTPAASTHVLADRYELLELIGSGGAGAVWRGHDRVLERTVAVKLLHRDLAADDRASTRFRAEAAAAAKLTHANAVILYDIGHSDGGDYLVMELVEGGTLVDLLEGGRLPPGVAAALGTQVARALGAAHDAGLVHRDVKPGNVLVTRDGVAKVTDFGIARALGDTTSRLTLPGHVMGTARYLAPEQLRDEPVDARADVYALGLLLHHAITARPPFGDGSAVEVAMRRLATTVPRMSELFDDISPELDEVIARATRIDPEERFEDGSALAAQLARHADPRAARELAFRLDQAVGDRVTDTARPRTAALQPNALPPPNAPPERAAPADGPPADVRRDAVPPDDADVTARTPAWTRATSHLDEAAVEPAPSPPAARPRRSLVWLALLAFVVIGIGAAVTTMGGDDPDTPAAEEPPAETAESEEVPPEIGALEVVDGSDHDPFGSGDEHPGDVPNAYDGDPDTAWHTQRYRGNPELGGLKPGVGIWLDLGDTHEISEVVVTTPNPGASFTIFAGAEPPSPDADPDDWGQTVGSVDDAGAEASLEFDEPIEARVWLLWFTVLPPDGGQYRAAVSDVTLVGS